MVEESFQLDLVSIKGDLQRGIRECSKRGLVYTSKWFAELNYALKHVEMDKKLPVSSDPLEEEEFDTYILCKSYFDAKEYDRCTFFSKSLKSACGRFLNAYSKYMSIDKKRIERGDDGLSSSASTRSRDLEELGTALRKSQYEGKLDSYLLYVYGLVLKKLDLIDMARNALSEAVIMEPLNWAAWLELSLVIQDRSYLKKLNLPNHWLKNFFLGHVYVELQLGDEAHKVYTDLQNAGFQESTFILDKIGVALHNKREVEKSIAVFKKLQKMDPYRLDGLDTYSNLLYVREQRIELAYLAQHAVTIDKYRVETCCIIANYYGLRGEHQKAVQYFQRALKLNPQYLCAWTLMGHEYMEMKNIHAAIQSYRSAIEVYRLDYRAWYGLGQAYEVLRMPLYACMYYREAQALKPNDARMLIALGEIFEKLERTHDAWCCFYKARSVGDHENVALLKLAKLCEAVKDTDEALVAYTEYVALVEATAGSAEAAVAGESASDLCLAYRFLANTHLKYNRLKEAFHFAQRCLNHEETKEEGKAILRTIAQKGVHEGINTEEDKSMQVESSDSDVFELSRPYRIRKPNLPKFRFNEDSES